MDGQVVYGDVLFIINFSMDFLVLFCCGRILHLRAKGLLLSASAAIGAAWSVASLFVKPNALVVALNIAVSFLLCFAAYPKLRGKLYFKCAALFYGISLLLGGGVTASYMLLNKLGRGVNVNSGVEPALSDIPLWLFCVLGAVCFILSFITGRIFTRGKVKKSANVVIGSRGGSVKLLCLCDSGNLLREPLSGAPVVLVSYDAVAPCLDEELKRALRDGTITGDCDVRVIPCGTPTGGGLLYGFLPEYVDVDGLRRRAVVAVGKGAYREFDGVVPETLLP